MRYYHVHGPLPSSSILTTLGTYLSRTYLTSLVLAGLSICKLDFVPDRYMLPLLLLSEVIHQRIALLRSLTLRFP